MAEPESEDKEVDPGSENKYEIFEYLLKFLNTDEEVNPVLAGYFSKLVSILF
jgi:hypothetical protein